MEKPLVSILIPCYNAEKWIKQAIQSALDQSYSNKEIIIVDDGSKDGSLKIIESFSNKIKYEIGPHRGANIARNRLLDLSRGEWLQYLDADDYLLPDKIEKQINFLLRHPEADVVYSQVLIELEEKGKIIRKSAEGINPLRETKDIFINLARWRLSQTGGCLFKKKAIIDVGAWKEDQPCCQEHELYLRLLMAGKKFVFCEEEEAIYRLICNETVSRKDPLKVIKERMRITTGLESWLRSSSKMNSERQKAINMARFECARNAYRFDKKFANDLIKEINKNDKKFILAKAMAPFAYRVVYKVLGFSAAENIAFFRRKIVAE